MIFDLDSKASGALPEYDLCIVGSGPAGMTLACELASSGMRICVLESGLERTTKQGDALRATRSEGIHIKEHSRERVLGGASTTWSGLSSPYDAIDTEERAYLDHSAWPVPRAELDAAYRVCSERYRFPALETFEGGEFDGLRVKGDLKPDWEVLEEKVFLAAAEPQNFGREWRAVFEDGRVDLYLGATAVELISEACSKRIAAVSLVTTSGASVSLRAVKFVIATGGIENARLLLLSRDLCSEGLGNEHDQVGRYFMNHPKSYFGTVRFSTPVVEAPYYFGCMYKGFSGYAGLRIAPKLQLERELLDSYIRLEPIFSWTDSHGVEALVLLVKSSGRFFRSWKKRHSDKLVELRDYAETGDDSELQNSETSFLGLAWKVMSDLPRVLSYLFFRLSKAKPKIREARVRNFMEMEPHAENRVLLADELDANGKPIAFVMHACTERDQRSMIAIHEELAAELKRTGIGELVNPLMSQEPWPIAQDASHHMGTTRMGLDPRVSVVDANLKLHGADNVWMAGGSVFPTSGCANPTMTLVALSVRLAKHIEGLEP